MINFAWPSAYSLPCNPGLSPGTPRLFFRPHSQPALSLAGLLESAWPRTLARYPAPGLQSMSMKAAARLGARLGLECRGQERELGSQRGGRSLGARASPCTEERRGACLRRASLGLPAQGWAPRAGGGLWKLRSRCPCTPGTAATTRISGQNKRCSRAAVASGQHMTGGVCSFLHC